MTVQIDPFHAITIGRLAHSLAAAGRSIIHMEYGQPSTGAPRAAIEKAHHILDSEPMGYWESDALKARISRHYRESYDVDVSPDRIVLTCGASPALVLALNSGFAPGDRIAMARPGYVAYRNSVKALHMAPVELPCGAAEDFLLSAAQIAAIDPAPAGLILASPANPTGTVTPPHILEEIARVCAARGIRIVSDEIYHGLTFGAAAQSMLIHAPDAFVINSFSKYFSMAGWRLGWLVVPPDHVDAVHARMSNLFLTPPVISQHAGLAAFDCRAELEDHVAVYRRNRDLMLEHLPKLGLTRIAPPDGAFYIYANISHLTNDSLDFCKRLLADTGVATAPGVDFDPVDGNHFMRFSFAVSTAEIEEALDRMTPWFAAQGRSASESATR